MTPGSPWLELLSIAVAFLSGLRLGGFHEAERRERQRGRDRPTAEQSVAMSLVLTWAHYAPGIYRTDESGCDHFAGCRCEDCQAWIRHLCEVAGHPIREALPIN